jgi:hypothetical protein
MSGMHRMYTPLVFCAINHTSYHSNHFILLRCLSTSDRACKLVAVSKKITDQSIIDLVAVCIGLCAEHWHTRG